MFFVLILLMAGQGTEVPAPCQARLELHQQDGLLTVTGHCRNLMPTTGRFRYELSLLRESSSGRSQNTQRGEFNVAPQQEIALSQSSVNTYSKDTYRIFLRVLDFAGHTVAQDSASRVAVR